MINKLRATSALIPDPEKSVMAFKRGVSAGALRHIHNTPGTKLVKRFIKRARGEAHAYRKTLTDMYNYVDIR